MSFLPVERPQPRAVVPLLAAPSPLSFGERVLKFLQPRTSPAKVPEILVGGSTGYVGMIAQNTVLARTPGAMTWRAYAQTPWVFAGINIRLAQVSSADWDIVPYDNTKRIAARQRDALRKLFSKPSATLDSFQSFAKMVIRELLILDGAPIEKVRYPDGSIAELWPARGDWITVDARWDGSDPEKPRYFWVPDGVVRASFLNEDMVYLKAHDRAESPLGISPMYVLQTIIESELQALEYNRRQVMGAAPDGVFNIGESAAPEDVQKAESKFRAEIFGQGAMAVIGGYKNPTWMPFRSSNREMQFREWEDLLIRCIAVVLGLSPMDLGITFDVNRSTAETQAGNTEDRGLRPLMSLFQSYMTREIVWDKSFGGPDNNLAFRFADLTIDESQAKANVNKTAMPGVGWKAINEARRDSGRPPINDPNDEGNVFNHILIGTPKGIIDLNTGKYLGEADLAQVQAQAKADLATAVGAQPNQPPDQPAQGAGA